jgi:hypothetical protein
MPDAPVAPFTSTVSPATNFARSVSAAHDDMPGIAMAAATVVSRSSGTSMHWDDGTTVTSAIVPSGDFGNVQYTRRPSSRTPTPSTPAMSGYAPAEL